MWRGGFLAFIMTCRNNFNLLNLLSIVVGAVFVAAIDKCLLRWWFFKRFSFSLIRLEQPTFLICAAVEIWILLEWLAIRLARLFLQKTPIIIFSPRCTRGSFAAVETKWNQRYWFFFACVAFILKRNFSCFSKFILTLEWTPYRRRRCEDMN